MSKAATPCPVCNSQIPAANKCPACTKVHRSDQELMDDLEKIRARGFGNDDVLIAASGRKGG